MLFRSRDDRQQGRDRGDTMLMSAILVGFLMVGSLALINASDAWGHRRELQSIADAASRAAAQVTSDEVRSGVGDGGYIDPAAARSRARRVIPDGFALGSLVVNGDSVTVVVTGVNEVPFPGPSFGDFTGPNPDGGHSATSTARAATGAGG